MQQKTDDDFSFEIIESIGLINVTQRGWNKELNFVRWNTNAPKFDIRDWHPDHGKMGRGITLTQEELIHLAKLIQGRFPDEFKAVEKTAEIKPAESAVGLSAAQSAESAAEVKPAAPTAAPTAPSL